MYSTSKVGLVISYIIPILGAIGILFIPFINVVLKLLLIISIFLIIQIIIWINCRKNFTEYKKLGNDCRFIELLSKLEKKYNENNNPKIKPLYEFYLFLCYSNLHEFDKMKILISRIEDKYSKMKDSFEKIYYNYNLYNYYVDIRAFDKALELQNEMKRLLLTVNLDYNPQEKQKILLNYPNMNYSMILTEEKPDKKILQEAEKYYLNRFNNEILLFKVTSAIRLITIYEKLGEQEKAKEYAYFVIKNHNDYYIDSKVIVKYGKS